ncbi:MAG: 5'-nucleotidase C-terminal domain-containing protein [Vampirovibrio sp.]|nr:5'-nucleotidase C-terminal domain-containing protein [Vampirovibrio sp.]
MIIFPVYSLTFGSSRLRLLHTSDSEGNWRQSGRVIAEFKALKKQATDEGKDVLTFHAGDMGVGQTKSDYGDRFSTTVKVWNQAGLDAFVPGNHDQSAENWVEDLKNIAQFQTLGVNFKKAPGHILPWVEKTLERSGKLPERYGVIGVTLPNIHKRVPAEYNKTPLESEDLKTSIDLVRKTITDVQRKGINKIIAVSHMGLKNDIALAKEVPAIDVIVGGHTHFNLPNGVWLEHENGKKTLVLQTNSDGNFYGKVDVSFDDSGNLEKAKTHVRILQPTQPVDPPVAKVIGDYKKSCKPIAAFVRPYHSSFYKYRPNPVADYLVDAMRNMFDYVPDLKVYAKQSPSWPKDQDGNPRIDFGVLRSNHFRSSLPAGLITDVDLDEFLPMQSPLAIVRVRGQDIVDALQATANFWSGADVNVGHDPRSIFPAGFSYKIDASKPGSKVEDIIDNRTGKPLETKKEYVVVTDRFNVRSKDRHDFQSLNINYNPGMKILWESKPAEDGVSLTWLMSQLIKRLNDGNVSKPIDWQKLPSKNNLSIVEPKGYQYPFTFKDRVQRITNMNFGLPPQEASL